MLRTRYCAGSDFTLIRQICYRMAELPDTGYILFWRWRVVKLKAGRSNVLVPTHIWKLLYCPAQGRAGAYVITNDDPREYSAITVF